MGGSWACGSYWSQQEPDETFFAYLNKIADVPLTGQEVFLRTDQSVKLSSDTGKQTKEEWENDIFYYHVGRNIDFTKRATFEKVYKCKPYLILNSTHSVTTILGQEFGSPINDSFQITPDYLGTINDGKSDAKGFFVNHRQVGSDRNFQWERRNWSRYYGPLLKILSFGWYDYNSEENGTTLAKAMSHSSGVIGTAVLLEYSFHLLYKQKHIKGIRNIYDLSDGGKTENLGLLPLVERGVDLIIASDMGRDSEENPLESFQLAAEQVQKIGRKITPLSKGELNQIQVNTSYKDNGQSKKIIYIKPLRQNISGFISYLKNQKLYDVVHFLELEKNSLPQEYWFPQTDTFQFKYNGQLIRAYYFLGKYIAKNKLNKEIKQWLQSQERE